MVKTHKLFRTNQLYFFIYLTILIVISAFVIYNLLGLRPIADDYCHAAAGGEGLVNYLKTFYFSWNSDVLALVVNYFILGLPLATLPYSIASALTFFISITCINLLIICLFFDKLRITTFLKILPVTLLSYLGFWITSKVFSQNSNFIDLSNMIIHWQTINGFYIFLSSLSFFFLIFMANSGKLSRNYFKTFFIIGLFLGTSGVLLIFTILLFNLIYMLFLFVTNSTLIFKRFGLFTIGLSFGILITFFSPGTRNRSGALRPSWLSPNLELGVLFNWTFPLSLFEWLQGVMHPGAIVAVAFGFTIGVFSKNFGATRSLSVLSHNFLIVLTLSIVSSILSQLSEAFSYEAFWHLAIPYLLIFLMCLTAGMIIGIIVSSAFESFVPMVLVIALSLTTTVLNMRMLSKDVSDRQILWQNGPASFSKIGDIEDKNGWIFACWKDMREIKGYPDR